MSFDYKVMEWIQALGGAEGSGWQKFMDFFFCAGTFLCEEMFLLIAIFVVYWAWNKKFGYYLVMAMFASIGFNGLFKTIVARPRPFLNTEFQSLRYVQVDNMLVNTTGLNTSYSFPSGHSQLAGSLFTTLAYYFKKRWLTILSVVLILYVMMSRVYLGVHYPTDTIVGGLLGVGVAFAICKIMNKHEEKKILIAWILAGIVAITLIVDIATDSVSIGETSKMLGLAIGAISGIMLEEKNINFTVDGLWWKRVLRVVLGFALVMAVRLGFSALFDAFNPGEGMGYILDGFRYFCIGIVATYVWPLIFTKANL